MSSEYRALVDKVDAFAGSAFSRRAADMACSAGCSSCCEVWLTVSDVEATEMRSGLHALSVTTRAQVVARGRHEQARERAGEPDARCAMLEADGRCAIYEHRPLVCRTQGHALQYPQGFVPEAAVRARTRRGEVTHCRLNFTQAPPRTEDLLDAERVDQILAVVNQRHALARGIDPLARFAISSLAAEADDTERAR